MKRLLLLSLVLLAAVGCTKKKACTLGSLTFADGALDPSNPCQSCQYAVDPKAFTPVTDGTACGAGKVCQAAACEAGCFIDGAVHAAGADPANACQTCTPATSTTAWAHGADGAACGNGKVCVANACVDGCFIDGARQATGTQEPTNECRACRPTASGTQWSPQDDGTPCGTLEVCFRGSCTRGCTINGQLQNAGTANPANPCETCQPSLSTTAWTPQASGTACGTGRVCDHDSCIAACSIGGTVYTPGLQNPANLCESCDPTRSTTAWSTAADGLSCGAGEICASGVCEAGCFIGGVAVPAGQADGTGCLVCAPATSTTAWSNGPDGALCRTGVCRAGACGPGCTIAGTTYAEAAVNPANPCQLCTSALSNRLWSDEPTGHVCAPGQICNGTICGAGCFIGNVSYPPGAAPSHACGTCIPAVSTSAWTPTADGTQCTAGSGAQGQICEAGACTAGCFISGAGYADGTVNPANACQVCQRTTPTAWTAQVEGTACAPGQICNLSATCVAGCYIGAFYPDGTSNASDVCQVCHAATSTTTWSAAADGTVCSTCNVCSSGVCSPAVLARQGTVADSLTVSGSEATYSDYDGNAVVQVNLQDGGVQVLATGLKAPQGVATDGTNVYVTEYSGSDIIEIFPDGGTTVAVAGLYAPHRVQVVGSKLYWADPADVVHGNPGQVGSLDLGTGARQTYVTTGAPVDLAVDGTTLYWVDSSTQQVLSTPLAGGVTLTVPAQGTPVSLSQDATHVYWSTQEGILGVAAKPLSASTTTYVAPGDPDPNDVASDGVNLYWAVYNNGSGQRGGVKRMPLAGGVATTLYSGTAVSQLELSGACVYFTSFNGSAALLRTDK